MDLSGFQLLWPLRRKDMDTITCKVAKVVHPYGSNCIVCVLNNYEENPLQLISRFERPHLASLPPTAVASSTAACWVHLGRLGSPVAVWPRTELPGWWLLPRHKRPPQKSALSWHSYAVISQIRTNYFSISRQQMEQCVFIWDHSTGWTVNCAGPFFLSYLSSSDNLQLQCLVAYQERIQPVEKKSSIM